MKMRDIFLIIIGLVIAVTIGKKVFADVPHLTTNVVLDAKNHTSLIGDVNGESINFVLSGIANSDPTKPFYVFLDTPGGQVLQGRRLVSFLQTTNRNVICVANTAISMGFVILQACPVRLMTQHGILMSHQIAGGAQGPLDVMKAGLIFVQKLADMYDTMMANRMGMTLEAYRAKINPEFWMVGIKEGLEAHAVDGEAKVTCTNALEKSSTTIGEGKETGKVSRCPIA